MSKLKKSVQNKGKLKKDPRIKNITVAEDKYVHLSWIKIKGATKYAVKRSTSPDGDFELIKWVKKTKFTDKTAEENVTYWYSIVAWKRIDSSTVSKRFGKAESIVISDIPAPEKVALTGGRKTEIKLSWEKPKGYKGCIISRRNDFRTRVMPLAVAEGKSYKDTEIVTGQPYHYVLQYFKTEGENTLQGNFSEEFDCIHLDCGSILSAKRFPMGKVKLSLRLVAGADGYIVYGSDKEEGEYREILRSKDAFDLDLRYKPSKAFGSSYYKVAAYRVIDGKEFRSVMSDAVKV